MLTAWIAFVGYAAAAIGLGVAARRRRDRGDEYWTAGRRLGPVSVGLSISAGFLSVSWSCVYAVQLFYWYGVGALWLITVPWLLALAGIYALSGRYHALPSFSQPEMVGRRFGATARRVVAVALIFVFLVWGGAEIYVAATLLSPGLGISPTAMIFVIALVVAAYATLGGFRAVVDTDKLQYAVVVLYILTMGWLAAAGLGLVGGGAPAAISGGTTGAPGAAGAAGATLTLVLPTGARSGTPWTDLLAPGLATIVLTFAAYLPGWLFETDLWLRVQAARDRTAARRGVALAAVNAVLFVGLLPLFIGVAALAIFPADGGMPAALGNEGDAIFVALVEAFAPEWLGVIVAVGLTAAAMSTIDTCTNIMALSFAHDLCDAGRRPDAERFSQRATAAAVAAAATFALFTESLWDVFYLSSGVLTTTVAFPVAAVFLPWATPLMVTASAICGFAATVVAYFLEAGGYLQAIEPAWLADSGLGYIVWGMAAAAIAALIARAAGSPTAGGGAE